MKLFHTQKAILALTLIAGFSFPTLASSEINEVERKEKAKKEIKYNEKGEIIKTGLNFGPCPAVAFDADKGFQLGALLNIYDFGNGETYPNPRQQWYMEASFFTKGSQLYILNYDNRFSIPGVRISAAMVISNDKAMDFYGFNGYQSFYDHEKMEAGLKGKDFLYSPFYKTDRLSALIKCDFQGNLWDNKLFWLAGYNLRLFNQHNIVLDKINKGKKEEQMFPSTWPTLYELYQNWGIIPQEEINKTVSSALRLGLEYDTRDKEGAPTRGLWISAMTTLAPKFLGSTVPYYKYTATFRHYIPLVKNDVLTFAYRLHYDGTFGKSAPHYILPYSNCMGIKYDKDGMGSYDTVRGILRDRVVGLDMATYNAELRWRFINFRLGNQNIALGLSAFSDGAMVTRNFDIRFNPQKSNLKDPNLLAIAQERYDEYMKLGQPKEMPHITVGGGFRFIMNENFILCAEYGLPVGKLHKQDGNGAFYINAGYLF